MTLGITSSLLLFLAFSTTTFALSLIDTLYAIGATQFARRLQANPEILALYESAQVHTVFAPLDISTSNKSLVVRDDDATELALQSSTTITQMATAMKRRRSAQKTLVFPGIDVETLLKDPQLDGRNQSIVAQIGINTTNTGIRLRRNFDYGMHSEFHHTGIYSYTSCDEFSTTFLTTIPSTVSSKLPIPIVKSSPSSSKSLSLDHSSEIISHTLSTPELPPSTSTCVTSNPPPSQHRSVPGSVHPSTIPNKSSSQTSSLIPSTSSRVSTSTSSTTPISVSTFTPASASVALASSPAPSPKLPPSTGVTIASGLGNTVNLVKADIPFDGGFIQLTDGYFTVPVSLSETLRVTGETSFLSDLIKTNLSGPLDASSSITVFAPTNAAFAAATNLSSASLPDVLKGHVIPHFLGYLPELRDGASYKTLNGDTITITVRNNAFFVNDAMIVRTNLVTANGVVHVIDKVLRPSPAVSTSGSRSLRLGITLAFAAAASASTILMMIF